MAPHSSTLAWKTPWMEEPGGLQSMGSLRVGHEGFPDQGSTRHALHLPPDCYTTHIRIIKALGNPTENTLAWHVLESTSLP